MYHFFSGNLEITCSAVKSDGTTVGSLLMYKQPSSGAWRTEPWEKKVLATGLSPGKHEYFYPDVLV
jgi:hypothetical protein